MSASRPHHYTFAHRATPGAFWRDPAEFVAALRSEDGQEIVTNVWNAIGADLEEKGVGAALASDGLRVTVTELDGRDAAVISLPEPQVMTEAWFIAVVAPTATPYAAGELDLGPDLGDDGDDRDRSGNPPSDARYFTLEKTISLAAELDPDKDPGVGPDLAVLCEWTHDGTHANTSVVVAASLERFEVAVLERL